MNDLDYAAQGGWITTVERLIRWLKNNDCNEYAQPLSQRAKSFHQSPTDRHQEQRALAEISQRLKHLRSEPPTDLDPKKRERLGKLVQSAVALVELRLQQMPDLIECDRNANVAVRNWMQEHDWSDVENEREGNFLEALYHLGAVDAEHRATLSEVVKKAEGPAANCDNFKQLAAKLGRKGLTASRAGRGGGCWLTERSKAYVEQERKV